MRVYGHALCVFVLGVFVDVFAHAQASHPCIVIFMTDSASMNFNAMIWQLVTVLDMTPVLPNLQTNTDLHIYLLIQPTLLGHRHTSCQFAFTLKRLYLQVFVRK